MKINKKRLNFLELPIGTLVFSMIDGYGEITKIDKEEEYPIEVEFDNGDKNYYTKYGYYFKNSPMPVLFLKQFKIPEEAYQLNNK